MGRSHEAMQGGLKGRSNAGRIKRSSKIIAQLGLGGLMRRGEREWGKRGWVRDMSRGFMEQKHETSA